MFRLHANTSNQSHHCLVVTQSKCWTWCYIWLLLCHNRLLKLFLCLLKYGLISLLTRVQLAPLTSRNMRKSNRNKASAPGSQHEVLHAAPFSWEWEEQRISVCFFFGLVKSGLAHHCLMSTPFFHSVLFEDEFSANTFSVYLGYTACLDP